jgi:hypothetical protein
MMTQMRTQNRIFSLPATICLLLATVFGTACDDFLDITPTGRVIPQSTEEFRSLLTRAYLDFPRDRGLTTFRSDEADLSAGSDDTDISAYKDIWIWKDDNPDVSTVAFGWKNYYTILFIANTVIENEHSMTGGLPAETAQLTGEAFLLRALTHFTLVNLYAAPYDPATAATDRGIPLKRTSNVDQVLPRNTVAEVYASILADVAEAQTRLNVDRWDTGLNYRFNKISAEAFLSRIYLYMHEWKNALAAARNVLAVQDTLVDLKTSGQLPPNHYKSPESIVALEQTITDSYQGAGRVNPALIAMYTDGDRRKANFYETQTSSISKVNKGGKIDYRCSFRTGEIYLNAAEAAVQDSADTDIAVARTYLLRLLQTRYSVNAFQNVKAAIEAMDRTALLTEIYRQRFLELAYEGHRWFDLRRTTQPRIEKPFRGETFVLQANDPRYTLKIPHEAIINNPNLAN